MLFTKIKTYFTRSEFIKNSAILVSGTTIAQLIPIAISPILSRIYSPEDFGVLTIFSSLTIIFSSLANGKYELAMVLPKKDSDALNLLAFAIYLSGILSLVLMIAILFFHDFFIKLLDAEKLGGWLYLLPLVVFFLAGNNSMTYYYTRMKNYKIQAKSKVVKAIATSIIQLGLFFLNKGILALITGFSVGHFTGNTSMLRGILKDKEQTKTIKFPKMLAMAKRYSKFPKMNIPATFFSLGSSEMPGILIAPIFNTATLGLYSFGYRMLSLPSSFIGLSISQVFMQSANDEFQKTGKCIKIFNSVLKKMLLIGIPFFGILAFVAEPVFGFVFGKEWAIAGYYAQLLTPFLFFRFVVGSLSSLLYVFEKHTILLILQIVMFIITIISFLLSYLLKLEFDIFLIIFSSSLSLYYLVYLFLLWLIAQKKL
jgi:O-antigen/teichoic acid export membrane protein